MAKKVRFLGLLADRISELSNEIMQREEEIAELKLQLACVESDLYTKGFLLDLHGSVGAWKILDDWHDEWLILKDDIDKTQRERDQIRFRVEELEDDQARVKRNEPTLAEEINAHFAKLKATPLLWTTAGSLGQRCCHPYAKPSKVAIGTTKTAMATATTAVSSNEASKVAKRKKRRTR